MESQEMKAARHIVNGQFMNEMAFRIFDDYKVRRARGEQIKPVSLIKALGMGLGMCLTVAIFLFDFIVL